MQLSKFLPAFLIACLAFVKLSAQHAKPDIESYVQQYPQEKTYLHYDKSSYTPGDTIWFKAYMMSGALPTNESKTFYVDWTDQNGKLLTRGVYPVMQAGAHGNFTVPAGFKGDYIRATAYTKWMLNFDSSFIYQKEIRILQPAATTSPIKEIIPLLQFFPEGGDMIAGLSNKIAFKASDQWGRPVTIKAAIVDSKDSPVDSLKTIHDGMGFFYIQPKSEETYMAKWKDDKGNDHSTPLPPVRKEGVALQVTVSGDKRTVSIQTNSPTIKAQRTIHVMGTLNQHYAFNVSRDISGGSAKLIIPVNELLTGVLTLTVFDNQWQPLAERITFVNNNEAVFQPAVQANQRGVSRRARNTIDILLPDTMPVNMSVSVTDAGIDADNSDHIIAHLLLSSEIKGKINNPAYYFTAVNDTINQHLDLVMLTHGWRRFKWEQLTTGKIPPIIYPRDTSYLFIEGRIQDVDPSFFKKANIVLMVKPVDQKATGQNMVLPVGPDGTFGDPNALLFDSVNIFYQLTQKKGFQKASVTFMENLLPPRRYDNISGPPFHFYSTDTASAHHRYLARESARLSAAYQGKLLDNVIIKSRAKTRLDEMDERYTNNLFKGDATRFDLTEDPLAKGAMTTLEYLQSRMAGIRVTLGRDGSTNITWRGEVPQLYLDEMPANAEQVQALPMPYIAYIKIFRPPFMGNFGGISGGAIAIYTRRGADIASQPGSLLTSKNAVGYSLTKQFYSPAYETDSKENEAPDLRTTLYWNPQLRGGGPGKKISFSFHNNDISKSFRVILEGMTQDGRLAHVEYIIE